MSEYISGKKSSTVLKVKLGSYERHFYFPELTDTEKMRDYIVEAAKEYEIPVNPSEIYYIGNKMIGIEERYHTLADIDQYLIFLSQRINNQTENQSIKK